MENEKQAFRLKFQEENFIFSMNTHEEKTANIKTRKV